MKLVSNHIFSSFVTTIEPRDVQENRYRMMENNVENLRKRILPVLLFCQANKGDLSIYNIWNDHDNAGKKLFYAYYSGIFCRILCHLDNTTGISRSFVHHCYDLLDKYNWYDIQDKDIELFKTAGPYGCEVPESLEFIEEVDNTVWKGAVFDKGRDAVCFMVEHGRWTFADVRGSVHSTKEQ